MCVICYIMLYFNFNFNLFLILQLQHIHTTLNTKSTQYMTKNKKCK
jgi:hypothetical protein